MKDRNGMDLTEAEDIKRKWQEYTGELYTKDLHNHNGITDSMDMNSSKLQELVIEFKHHR